MTKKIIEAKEQLNKGIIPEVSVREFLSWFGALRRRPNVISNIRKELDLAGIVTDPDFESAFINSSVKIQEARGNSKSYIDPTPRVGRLTSANNKPISVSPSDTLQKAITLMMSNDFSQLPVMNSERDIKGVISWKSIASSQSLGKDGKTAKDYMYPPLVLKYDATLFEVIEQVAKNDFVFIKSEDERISGIVTATDLNDQFRTLAEPFLLIGEIEIGIRRILHGRFSKAELNKAISPTDKSRSVESISDLTLGEYVRLLENDQRWEKLNLKLDKVEFKKQLDRVRELRNDVMHFDPDGLETEDINFLHDFSRFLITLRSIGVA